MFPFMPHCASAPSPAVTLNINLPSPHAGCPCDVSPMLAALFPFDDFGLDCGFGCCDDYDGLPLPEEYADLPRTDAVPDPHPTGVTPVRPAAFPRPAPAAQAMPPVPDPAGERHGRCVPLGVCPTCGGMTER